MRWWQQIKETLRFSPLRAISGLHFGFNLVPPHFPLQVRLWCQVLFHYIQRRHSLFNLVTTTVAKIHL